MANTAFTHDPTITVPSSSTANGVVLWNGTTGKNFNNTKSQHLTFNGVLLDIQNDDSAASEIRLYCDTGNAHYQAIRGGQHSGATSYTMILPHVPPTATQVLTTASISSNVAVLDWADTASSADDTAYASSWNGVTTIPPSKNAVYDKIETITAPDDTAYASSWNGITTIAPSKNAVYDKIELLAPIAGATFTGTTTFGTLSDGTIGVTAFLDADNMSGASATTLSTSESIKAYVDASGVTAPLRLADGSTAAPTYSFSGATDMGMVRSTTELRFSTGGTVKLAIDANSLKFREGSPAGGADGVTFRVHNTQNVGTSTTIITDGDAAQGGLAFIAGRDSGNSNRFSSFILFGRDGFTVLGDITIRGTVPTRTYSVSAGTLRLAMASGTYDVELMYFIMPNMG
jgi:hypothetical protein